MNAIISQSSIHGDILAPPSKSAFQRACALALLNDGETIISNPGKSNDDLVAMQIIRDLGAHVHFEMDRIIIRSNGRITGNGILHCGESGLSFRMFAFIAAMANFPVILNGSGSLLDRPMNFLDEIFPLLNVNIRSENGFLPVVVSGPLEPKDISIDGSSSSQYLTGLLFSFASAARIPISIKVKDLKSKPYIDLSLQMLAHFGYEVSHNLYTDFYIQPNHQSTRTISYHTESDWSSASFMLVAGAISGSVNIEGLDLDSFQADKAIVAVLKGCNADMNISSDKISMSNRNRLQPFKFDATDCPDLFPPLAVLAAHCKGTSIIKGVSRLLNKESNRAESLLDVFTRMGIDITINDDEMIIGGVNEIRSTIVSSHYDHRIAMACSIAGLKSIGKIEIQHAEAVNKSYPAFYDHLKLLGASVSLEQ
jgi:3-phosphoshikimate 1-carboxyvinyltransferase